MHVLFLYDIGIPRQPCLNLSLLCFGGCVSFPGLIDHYWYRVGLLSFFIDVLCLVCPILCFMDTQLPLDFTVEGGSDSVSSSFFQELLFFLFVVYTSRGPGRVLVTFSSLDGYASLAADDSFENEVGLNDYGAFVFDAVAATSASV
jgi:hypothetical protein